MADVVIIGAGVIGCSTAYHLARMGITDVLVVNGHTSSMDIRPFRIGRFEGKAIEEVRDLRVFARQDLN